MSYNRGINLNKTTDALPTHSAVSNQQEGLIPMATSDSIVSSVDTQATYVYFISAGSTPIKIGISNDPAERLSALQTAHFQKLHLLYTIECKNRAAAFELETAFHRWYGETKLRNEWFNLTPNKIADDIHLLITIAQSIVVATQHISPEQIARMEEKAVMKLSRSEANKPRVKLREVAQLVRDNNDGNLPAVELMQKYGISLGSTTKIRELVNSSNGKASE